MFFFGGFQWRSIPLLFVFPAKAGTHCPDFALPDEWVPAFAGKTRRRNGGDSGKMAKQFAVYVLASDRHGTLYVGVTSDLVTRIWQHKTKAVPGFTSKYECDRLVYFEMIESAETAMQREKRIKKWDRDWKINLIETANPNWDDLYPSIAAG